MYPLNTLSIFHPYSLSRKLSSLHRKQSHSRTSNGPPSGSGCEEETAMTPNAPVTLGKTAVANNQIVTKTLLRLFKKEEEKKARILFVIIINFLLCNTLRLGR